MLANEEAVSTSEDAPTLAVSSGGDEPTLEELLAKIKNADRLYAGFIRAQTRLMNQRTAIHFSYAHKYGHTEFPKKPDAKALKATQPMVDQDFLYISLEKSIKDLNKPRNWVAKELVDAAKLLPFADIVQTHMRGLGLLTYARIIAQVKDFRLYSNPAKIWKRMGLAVKDGKAVKRIAGTSPEAKLAATAAGYSPTRRALMYIAETNLIRQNGVEGFYKKLYVERKKHELTKTLTLKDGTEKKAWPKVADIRARRFMVKRVLRDLWCLWNGKSVKGLPTNGNHTNFAP